MPARIKRGSEAWRRVAPDTSVRVAVWDGFFLCLDGLAVLHGTKPFSNFPCLEEKGFPTLTAPVPFCNLICMPKITISVAQCIIFTRSVSILNSWCAECAICLCNSAFVFNHVLSLLFFCQPLAMFHFSSKWKNILLKYSVILNYCFISFNSISLQWKYNGRMTSRMWNSRKVAVNITKCATNFWASNGDLSLAAL